MKYSGRLKYPDELRGCVRGKYNAKQVLRDGLEYWNQKKC